MAWPRSTLLLLLPAAGCAGQNVEGTWQGAFPLEGAKACELRLLPDHSATVQCDHAAIVGGGHYHWDGSRLEVSLPVLTYDQKKVTAPPPFVFKVKGHGNSVRAAYQGTIYEWKRTLKN